MKGSSTHTKTGLVLAATAVGLGGHIAPAQAVPMPIDKDVDLPRIKVVEVNPIVPCRVGKVLLRVRIPGKWAEDVRKPRIKVRVYARDVVVKSFTTHGTQAGLALKSCEATWALHQIDAEVRWTGQRLPWSDWKTIHIPRRWN